MKKSGLEKNSQFSVSSPKTTVLYIKHMVLINIRQKTRKDTLYIQKKAYLCTLLTHKKKAMKKIVVMSFMCMVASIMYGQLRVSASGTFGPVNNVPLVFDVNNVKSGSTGSVAVFNVSFGYESLLYSNGAYNTAFGWRALRNTTGSYNTAVGHGALVANTTGITNVAVGQNALGANTTASDNTALGTGSLQSNTTGGHNTATGASALGNNTTGSGNCAFGIGALYDNTTGYNNTAVGCWATSGISNLNNTTVIGYGATVTGSDKVRIGNTLITSIGGQVGWSDFSDGRGKKNIRQDVPGLVFINSLQPVTYNVDLDAIDELMKIKKPDISSMPQELLDIQRAAREAKEKTVQTGFVAQDVEKAAKSIGYDFSGVDVGEMGIYGLRYAEFVVPLVKAVQELSEQNDKLQEQNSRQQEQIEALLKRIEALEKK